VTGVHCLQHVDGLSAADLADDDSVRSHTQSILNQIALGNLALTLDVGWPGFQTNGVWLLYLLFCGVFNGDNALVAGNECGHRIKQRRLACTGAARDDHVQTGPHTHLENDRDFLG